jgi:crotonobetainyl-CoA:carnitine CoA-transferase CaiB-like acyl-CoA transferase
VAPVWWLYVCPPLAGEGKGGADWRTRKSRDEKDSGPLAPLKVLDLTENMAGPFCTMILADMGAEVIKLERPGKGEAVRAKGDGSERNPYFRYINRNKKGITLDYKEPEGRRCFCGRSKAWTCWSKTIGQPSCRAPGWDTRRCARSTPRLIYAQRPSPRNGRRILIRSASESYLKARSG